MVSLTIVFIILLVLEFKFSASGLGVFAFWGYVVVGGKVYGLFLG